MTDQQDQPDPWIEPVGDSSLDDRIGRLEQMADGYRQVAAEETRLAAEVERLGASTAALTQVLIAVDEQAQAIARVDRRASNIEADVEKRSSQAHEERRQFLWRAYAVAALGTAFALASVVGGAWLTDRHLQKCLVHGPRGAAEKQFCDLTFPGHDHDPDRSIDDVFVRQVQAARQGCERDNARTRVNRDRELLLADIDEPQARVAHQRSADALAQLLVDCDKAYPLPKVD